jgi:acyl-CoA synthetase (NDP forming)
MKRMFDPQTIALIGASEKESSLGRTIIENLLSSVGRLPSSRPRHRYSSQSRRGIS